MKQNNTIENLLESHNITHDATQIIDLMASYLVPIKTAEKALYDFCENAKNPNIDIDTFVKERIVIYAIFYNNNKEFYNKWNVDIQQGHNILFDSIPVEQHIKKFVDKYLE